MDYQCFWGPADSCFLCYVHFVVTEFAFKIGNHLSMAEPVERL